MKSLFKWMERKGLLSPVATDAKNPELGTVVIPRLDVDGTELAQHYSLLADIIRHPQRLFW